MLLERWGRLKRGVDAKWGGEGEKWWERAVRRVVAVSVRRREALVVRLRSIQVRRRKQRETRSSTSSFELLNKRCGIPHEQSRDEAERKGTDS
jgi:hypothetical protein